MSSGHAAGDICHPDDRVAPVATPRRSSATTVLHGAEAISGLRADWLCLSDSAGPCPVFTGFPAWQAWSETLSRDAHQIALASRQEGSLAGLLPLMIRPVRRGPTLGVRYDYDPEDGRYLTIPRRRMVGFRQLSPVLSLPATMLGPGLLAKPAQGRVVVDEFADAIAALPGWDVAVLPLAGDDTAIWREGFAKAGLTSRVQRLDRLAYSLAEVAPFNELIAQQDKKARQNYRRARAAAEKAGVRISLYTDPAESLAALAEVARTSWKAKGREGQHAVVPYAGAQQRFFERFLQAADAPQTVTAIAAHDGAPVAIMVAARHGAVLTTLLTFWNGAAKAASPGQLVLAALIDWAAEHRIELIDFNSNNPWLRNLADRAELHHNLLVFAPTFRGRALAGLSGAIGWARDVSRTRHGQTGEAKR